jgi:hypothetical protein
MQMNTEQEKEMNKELPKEKLEHLQKQISTLQEINLREAYFAEAKRKEQLEEEEKSHLIYGVIMLTSSFWIVACLIAGLLIFCK